MGQPFNDALDLRGVRTWTVGEGSLPTGVYACVIRKAEKVEKKTGNGENYVFEHEVTEEGKCRGRTTRIWIPRPQDAPSPEAKEASIGKIRSLLSSIGYTDQQIEGITEGSPGGGPIAFSSELVTGYPLWLHVVETTAAIEGEQRWIRRDQYEAYKAGTWKPKEEGKARQNVPAKGPAGTGTGASAAPGANPFVKDAPPPAMGPGANTPIAPRDDSKPAGGAMATLLRPPPVA